ncbi:MAG: transposase [Pseudomonadota bacterium]
MSGDDFARRFEIVAETRRRWSRENKLAIVPEASVPCVNISAVARRHGIKPALLYRWKKEFALEATPEMALIPVVVGEPPLTVGPVDPSQHVAATLPDADTIEITLANGRTVKVPAGLDAATLKRLLATIDA